MRARSTAMRNQELLGPWVRRFLIEHLIAERSLSVHTQHGYRDTLRLLLPFSASKAPAPVDRLNLVDISATVSRQRLAHLEPARPSSAPTPNQPLPTLHPLPRFTSEHS